MKALIVVDMPDGIKLDEYNAFINVERMCIPLGVFGRRKIYSDYFTFKFKPLRPMPSFKAVDLNDTRDVVMFCHGWNTCLAEITGETE